jgi:hypothetical protein
VDHPPPVKAQRYERVADRSRGEVKQPRVNRGTSPSGPLTLSRCESRPPDHGKQDQDFLPTFSKSVSHAVSDTFTLKACQSFSSSLFFPLFPFHFPLPSGRTFLSSTTPRLMTRWTLSGQEGPCGMHPPTLSSRPYVQAFRFRRILDFSLFPFQASPFRGLFTSFWAHLLFEH